MASKSKKSSGQLLASFVKKLESAVKAEEKALDIFGSAEELKEQEHEALGVLALLDSLAVKPEALVTLHETVQEKFTEEIATLEGNNAYALGSQVANFRRAATRQKQVAKTQKEQKAREAKRLEISEITDSYGTKVAAVFEDLIKGEIPARSSRDGTELVPFLAILANGINRRWKEQRKKELLLQKLDADDIGNCPPKAWREAFNDLCRKKLILNLRVNLNTSGLRQDMFDTWLIASPRFNNMLKTLKFKVSHNIWSWKVENIEGYAERRPNPPMAPGARTRRMAKGDLDSVEMAAGKDGEAVSVGNTGPQGSAEFRNEIPVGLSDEDMLAQSKGA